MKKPLKKGILFGLTFLLTVVFGTIGYAVWTNINPVVGTDNLTAALWNNLVTKINDIGTRTDNIYSTSGNVGIGVTPTTMFQVRDTTYGTNSDMSYQSINGIGPTLKLATSSNIFTQILFNQFGTDQVYLRGSSYGIALGGASPRFNIGYPDANYPNAQLAVSGSVSIGGTNPQSKLSVYKNIIGKTTSVADSHLYIRGADIGYGMALGALSASGPQAASSFIQTKLNDASVYSSASIPLLLNPDGGNVSIGTSSDLGFKLQVGNSGDGTSARSNSWTTFSDERLKKDFEVYKGALSKIDLINGYYFKWKTGEDKTRQFGVKAQEIEKVLPEIVHEDQNGIKSVDYSKLTPFLIEAVKELKTDNEELRKNNKMLLMRIEKLEEKK